MTDGLDTRETLHAAIRALASGTGTLKTRLRAAFTPEVLRLGAGDFPSPELGVRWMAVREELAPSQRPDIALARWWDFELSRIAEEIVEIYDQLTRR
jgi:hypothetical protein